VPVRLPCLEPDRQQEGTQVAFPRIILDTADIEHIRAAASTGLIDGVATNPEKVARSGASYRDVVARIRTCFDGPIAVQALGRSVEEICAAAREVNAIDPLLAVKVTADRDGLTAVRILAREGIRTNATLIFNPTQGLLAGLAGSPYISPFVSRASMAGQDGVEVIAQIRRLFDAFAIRDTCIIAASIKDVDQVIRSILAGAHAVAVPYPVFEAMCDHPLTRLGLDAFTSAYRLIPQDASVTADAPPEVVDRAPAPLGGRAGD
jgi:transaldolase